MTFTEFRAVIVNDLQRTPDGLTWKELQQRNHLPYDRPCPEWTKQLETYSGLVRERRKGRSLVWELKQKQT